MSEIDADGSGERKLNPSLFPTDFVGTLLRVSLCVTVTKRFDLRIMRAGVHIESPGARAHAWVSLCACMI